MTADFDVILNFNSATPVKTGAEFKAGDKGFTINMDVRELDPTGMTPKIAFYRSNGTSVESAAVTNVGNIFSYTLLGNELAVPGIVVADLKFYDGDDQRISSASFIFTAISDTLDGLGGGTESYSDELEQLSAEFQDTLDDYIDAFGNTAPINPRGDYDNTATYEPRDMVYDSNTGTSWVCKQESTGNAPTNGSAYWQKLVNGAGSMVFDDLSDVDMTGVQDGQVPAYDSNSGTYKPVTPSPGGVTSFNNRTGAVAPTAGDYDLAGLSDTNVSTPSDGQLLGYDGANSKWANVDKPIYSNPNLLINGWFTVNQRGFSSGSTGATYTADRWKKASSSDGTLTWSSSGFTFPASNSAQVVQPFESNPVNGILATMSIKYSDGTIASGTKTWSSGGNTHFIQDGKMDCGIDSAGNLYLKHDTSDANTRTIRAVKLEIGSTSTLALDAPPDYSTELLKCQWYYRKIKSYKSSNSEIGIGFVTDAEWVFISLPNSPMRTTSPTIALGGGMNFLYNGTRYTPTNVTFSFNSDASFIVWLKFTGTSFTAGQGGIVYFTGDGDYIEINCEL